MRFPSITPYIEAISNIEDRLRTFKNIRPVLDNSGDPRFYSSKGVVTFAVEHAGMLTSLRCFTSVTGYERVNNLLDSGIIAGEILENELFVFDNDGIGDYHSIFIQNTTKEIQDTINDEIVINEGMIPLERNGRWGYSDEKGCIIIEPAYTSVGEFSERRAVVEQKGMYGLIDMDGDLIIDTIFDEISWDGSSMAYVDLSGKWGCYDRLGREIVKCNYDWVSEFSNSFLLVKKSEKYGFVNLDGKEVIPLIYDSATSFNENGLASAQIYGEHVMINTLGEIEC